MKLGARILYEDHTNTLWFATNHSLYQILNRRGTYQAKSVYIKEENNPEEVRITQTTVLQQTSDGSFWIGTQQRGLRKSIGTGLPGEQSFRVYQSRDEEGALKSNRISSFLEDRSGRIWVGSYAGLHLYQPIADNFFHFSKRQGDIQSLSSDIILCLYEDSMGNLWIGTTQWFKSSHSKK